MRTISGEKVYWCEVGEHTGMTHRQEPDTLHGVTLCPQHFHCAKMRREEIDLKIHEALYGDGQQHSRLGVPWQMGLRFNQHLLDLHHDQVVTIIKEYAL
jgi:hypothetical protein